MSSNLSILIVDDDRNMLRILQLIFERADYQVHLSQSSTRTFDLIQELQPDVLLIDDMMPEITGSQACYQLKRHPQTAHLPIILFSAGSDVLDEHLMREIGADAALRKPAHPSLLISTVERLVKQRTPARV